MADKKHRNPIRIATTTQAREADAINALLSRELLYNRNNKTLGIVLEDEEGNKYRQIVSGLVDGGMTEDEKAEVNRKIDALQGQVDALSGKASTAGTADTATELTSKTDEMLVTNNTTVENFAKTVTCKYTAGTLLSRSDWSWANSRYIVLNSSVSVDTQRYSCLVVREGNLNEIWQQHTLLFIPTYADVNVLYLVQMTVSEPAGAVSTTVLPILSSKGGTFTGAVKCSSKLIIPIGAPSSIEDGCIWIQ